MNKKVVIATIKSWNIENAGKFKQIYDKQYDIIIITDKNDLTKEFLDSFKPDYIFFPHWSWKIEQEIYEKYKCIVFHTSNLPEGRGGSPIQNQILHKIYNSKINAIGVAREYDQGDIYCRHEISLKEGTIEDILINISNIVFSEMIPKILNENMTPVPQKGEAGYFDRRTPDMSSLLNVNIADIYDMYDFIRMLDGEGYPAAYVKAGKWKVEFRAARIENGKLTGRFEVYEE